MTLAADLTLSAVSPTRARLAWTMSDADNAAWVFANGELLAGPLAFDTTDATLDFDGDPEDLRCLEVHELAAGEACQACAPMVHARPVLRWNRVEGAEYYRVYRQAGADGDEELLATVAAETEEPGGTVALVSPATLESENGVWHFFRVEAVDKYGRETTRAQWAWLVPGLPPAPTAIAVTGTGPYTITATF